MRVCQFRHFRHNPIRPGTVICQQVQVSQSSSFLSNAVAPALAITFGITLTQICTGEAQTKLHHIKSKLVCSEVEELDE